MAQVERRESGDVSIGMALTVTPFLPQDLCTCYILCLECSLFILYLMISLSSSHLSLNRTFSMKSSLITLSKVGFPRISSLPNLVFCYFHRTFSICHDLLVYLLIFNLHSLLECKLHESRDCIHPITTASLAPSTKV